MSAALALEYEDVLKRDPDRIYMNSIEIDELVSFVCANATRREPTRLSWPLTNDPNDEFIARLAVTSGCDFLVTHNVRHLRSLADVGISVVTPGEFVGIMKGE